MITLKQLIEEIGINRNTLTKYRDLGLVPRPDIVHRGYKKAGEVRGNEMLYPDYTPWIIREITRLKAKGYGLTQIREDIGEVEDITPEEDISEPILADDMNNIAQVIINMGPRLDRGAAGYRRIFVEYETDDENNKLKVNKVWGVKEGG
ncbi:hypothetical protein ACFLX5_04345 [Chloroflexota bacterium]